MIWASYEAFEKEGISMNGIIYRAFGDPTEVLRVEDIPIPEPGVGQVRIKTVLASIHNHDLITIEGNYGYRPALPAVGGSEAMGIVDALGEGVTGLSTNLSIGQRVAVFGVQGAWAQYCLVQADQAIPLPETVSDEAGAQLMGMPLSALFLLESLKVTPGQWIVQNAATGAVAKVLAMTARTRGIHVVNLVRRREAIAALGEIGIGNVVSTQDDDWQDQVKAMVGDARVAAAVDGVGGPDAGALLSLLSEDGTLVSFGAMSGKPLHLPAAGLIFKQIVVKGFWLAKILRTAPSPEKQRIVMELMSLVAAGDVSLQVGGVFDLENITAAATASRQSGRMGKILVRP